ncbi:MAG: hypothetical protein WBW76_06455 [Candidatus Cybelea sp.]
MYSPAGARVDRPVVDRAELEHRIVNSGASVIELVAPAGFGKTYVARRVAERLGARIAADCRDMETLPSATRALLRALGPFKPAFESRLTQYLVALDPGETSAELWLDVLDEVLAQERNGRICWIENAEMLHEFRWGAVVVDRLIRKGLHVLVCAREALALPGLSRVPPNERYVVGIDDLRFSDAESEALFPLGVDRRSIARALDEAQGWPIAVLTYVRAAREGRLQTSWVGANKTYGARHLDEYILNEALSGLSAKAKIVLAAVAQLRDCSEQDVDTLSQGANDITTELQASPFVSWSSGQVEVHALASKGLAAKRQEATCLLRDAAARTAQPLRAAQLYMAAGDAEDAASLLDTVLAPYFLGESKREVVDLVSSLGEDVLTRHAPTWCATITLRAYAMSQHELLSESRSAWTALDAQAPMILRIGVGLTLINSLLFLNHTDEAATIFDDLQRRIDASGVTGIEITLMGYRAFAQMRSGRCVDVDAVMRAIEPLLRDVPESHASALTSFVSAEAFMRGDRDASRRALSRALEIARGVASPLYLVIGLCNAAFHAWLAGETALFESCMEELIQASGPHVIGGTHHFIGCATSARPAATVAGFEIHYLRAYGYIVAAGRESSAGGKRTAARLALDAAEEDGQPWLRAFCQAILACIDGAPEPEVQRALELGAIVEYQPLRDGIVMLARGVVPDRWPGLKSLIGDSLDPVLRLSFATNEAIVDGEAIALSRREMELALALALHDGPRDRQTLAAMMWPDAPEADGASAATVYIARLRRRLKNPELIESTRSGYRLKCRVDLDLDRLERIATSGDENPADAEVERVVRSKHSRLAQWMLLSEWLAPYARRYATALEVVRRRRAEVAASAGDELSAALYRRLIAAESPPEELE